MKQLSPPTSPKERLSNKRVLNNNADLEEYTSLTIKRGLGARNNSTGSISLTKNKKIRSQARQSTDLAVKKYATDVFSGNEREPAMKEESELSIPLLRAKFLSTEDKEKKT